MINNLDIPPIQPGEADRVLGLLRALSDAAGVEQMLTLVRQQQDRVTAARDELDKARAVFESEKQEWYAKSAREEEDHRKRMADARASFDKEMTEARAALDAERKEWKQKVDRVTAAAMA
jgi:hypothetical protein